MASYEMMKEAVDALEHVGNHITHKNHSFYELCTDFCQINEPIRQYLVLPLFINLIKSSLEWSNYGQQLLFPD